MKKRCTVANHFFPIDSLTPQEFLMIFSPGVAILGSPLINDVFFVAFSIAATRPVFKMVLKAGGKKAGPKGEGKM